jgi:hypothetical protein
LLEGLKGIFGGGRFIGRESQPRQKITTEWVIFHIWQSDLVEYLPQFKNKLGFGLGILDQHEQTGVKL